MQSKRLTKYLGVLLGVMILCALMLTGLSFFPRNSQSASGATKYLTVQKVFVPDKFSTDTINTQEFWHLEETAESISDGDFVVLDTTQRTYTRENTSERYQGREAVAISFVGPSTIANISNISIWLNDELICRNDHTEDSGTPSFSQYYFALTNKEVRYQGLNNYYYTKYSKNGTIVDFEENELPEGKYTISLTYFDTYSGEQKETITFYVVTQKTYNQVNENPTLNDTEKLDATADTNQVVDTHNQMTAMQNYFNFNNSQTTYYDTNTSKFSAREFTGQLYYPTLIYNPEKFDISYTRTLYNYRETVETSFSVLRTNEKIGYLDVYTTTSEDPNNRIKHTYELEANADGAFTVKMQFDKVGEYVFTKLPKLKCGFSGQNVNYISLSQNNKIVTTNQEYMSQISLTINGYSAYYSNTTTTTAPLYNDTFSYNTMENVNATNSIIYAHDFLTKSDGDKVGTAERTRAETVYTADMTFANLTFISNNGGQSVSMSAIEGRVENVEQFFNYITTRAYIQQSATYTKDGVTYYTKRASTNLAPVKFEFYGKLYTGTNSQYLCWYAHKDSSGNVTLNRYTRGMSFDDAGEYVVYLTYENPVYSLNNQTGSRKYQYMHQIFCFEITNNTPTISVFAQDTSAQPSIYSSDTADVISIDGYTNKYVYATWETAGPFDATIYCKYNVYKWDGTQVVKDENLEGLVYQNTTGGGRVAVSNNATILCGDLKKVNRKSGLDGHYQIQVFRSNNPKAWVNYTFNIDTAPISEIKALQVVGSSIGTKIDDPNSPIVLSELDYNDPTKFNLNTGFSFGFTWSEKTSGATISAQYLYARINKTTNFDLIEAITGNKSSSEQVAVNTLLEKLQSSGAIYMPTNASIGDFSPAMSYTKVEFGSSLTSSQIINTPQLAFLLLRDLAGNTAIFMTMLDTSNTQVLQVKKQSSFVNVITEDTQFYWGTHKSITAIQSSQEDTGIVRDVYDLANQYDDENENFAWKLNNKTYTSSKIITDAILDLNVKTTQSINIPLNEVTISFGGGEQVFKPTTKSGSASNYYATILVRPGETKTDEYRTAIVIDGNTPDDSTKFYTLEDGEFVYQITVADVAGNDNAGGLRVEVNMDKSLGSMRSYWDCDDNVRQDLSYSRNPDSESGVTDRQYVANTYSTNRRYVTFSWTNPGDPFEIESITLDFYAFSGNNTESDNYPYSDSPSRTITLYSSDLGENGDYPSGKLMKVPYGDGDVIFYQTGILLKLAYSVDFGNDGASESGKYVITRKYKSATTDTEIKEQEEQLKGDKMEKTYTYYIDRNTILPTSTYSYGDETLQFGYKKGQYSKYPNYPENDGITFNNYGLLTNTEKFDKLSFATENQTTSTPTNIIVKSNVLPASVRMTTWKWTNSDGNEYTVYDKYYTAPTDAQLTNSATAIAQIQSVLDNYKNSSRLQIAVQFFPQAQQYSLQKQTFYSTKTKSNSDDSSAYSELRNSLPLNKLQYAFTGIGRYRVIMFDLANFDGILTGDAYTDFTKLSYSITSGSTGSSKNNLNPNCSVVNFELTGVAPTFSYKASNENDYGPLGNPTYDTNEIITNYTKSLVTWSDSSDYYSARNGYNEVSITKTSIPKGLSLYKSSSDNYLNYFSGNTITTEVSTETKNPVEITYSDTVATSLKADGLKEITITSELLQKILGEGLSSITSEYDVSTAYELPYFLKVADKEALDKILNHAVMGTSLKSAEYYKVRKTDSEKLYTYYLLLPRANIENAEKSENKLVDTKYSVTIHYIAKDSKDYLVVDNKSITKSDVYYSMTSDLYLDYTAPYYNLVDLIKNDRFLNSLDSSGTFQKNLIANIDNPDSTFLKSYAFAVNKGFTLKYRNPYESGSCYYYYKRTQNTDTAYTGDKNSQVIIENVSDSSAPRFDKNSAKFTLARYSGTTYKATVFNEVGYYDIIEQDYAGNLRVYTIYVADNDFTIKATNGKDSATSSISASNNGDVINSYKFTATQNYGFTIQSFEYTDMWQHFKLKNTMGDETLNCYLIPAGAVDDIKELVGKDNETVEIYSDVNAFIGRINGFISTVALAHDDTHDDGYGSNIQVNIEMRAPNEDMTSCIFYINTQGHLIINSEQDFLNLITIDSTSHRFIIKMPNTSGNTSTFITYLEVYLISNNNTSTRLTLDDILVELPKSTEDFMTDYALNTGYIFSLSNDCRYKFTFMDNFGRTMTYSYPTDSSLVKKLQFSGNTLDSIWTDGNTYTYTANDVDFIYQSAGLNVSLYIEDMDTKKVLYQKDFNSALDMENKYFTYIRDDLSSNLITLRFNAIRGLHNLVRIQVDNGSGTITEFKFVMYTVFPQIIISDTNSSPIQNAITSKNVMITWADVNSLFDYHIEVIYPSGIHETITSGFVVKDEGTYTVRCVFDNNLGACTSSQAIFTIQEYLISIYGVYQILSTGETVQLQAFTDSYLYTTKDNRQLAISQYLFLSNDSNWDRNIQILCNEDKDLEIELNVETIGNTRISRVYGKDKGLYQLELYFAVTRIPSLNVANFTNFRIDGETTNRTATFKQDATTVTWTTSYKDSTATGYQVTYSNFFSLILEYNGTYVGTYTTGSLRLVNSGVYTISIVDPVGQKHYFGSNSTTFNLTILTNVIYYVNNNAGIPYATYSDAVDFYVPQLTYLDNKSIYDYTPVVTIYRNNVEYSISPNANGHYIISTPGSYKIVMRSSIEGFVGQGEKAQLKAIYQFVIVSPNEAIRSYDFTAIAGYEIIDVVRLDSDANITSEIKGENAKITSLHLDSENFGVGKYQITVRTEASGYNPSQTYTFKIWINDEDIIMTPSRDWGSSSRKGFSITLNTASVYERIGECQVMVNGTVYLAVNSSNSNKIDPTTIKEFTQQGDYIVQLVSASGTVLQSYRMTIQEPLNTAAIILIIVGILVVVVLTIVFVIMRRKVRVR